MKRKAAYILLAFVLSMSFIVTTAVPTEAADISEVWIDDDFTSSTPGWGITHFAKIQEGIIATSSGGTVNVRSGTYDENLSISKSLTLEGEDKNNTIISTTSVAPIINIQGTINVIIKNLTIKNNGREGVKILNSNNISLVGNNISGFYRECVRSEGSTDISIVGNSINASIRTGMTLISTNDSNFSNNMIFNNIWHGIYLSGSNGNTITGNTIYNNGSSVGFYGLFVVASEDNEVYNNNFIDNSNQAGTSFDCSGTKFNLDAPIGGNYWSDWTTPDVNPVDGFVDNPYEFGGGVDNLPWTKQDGWKKIEATVDIEPDTLNLDSKGKWITCYIELEESYDVADIDIAAILLGDTVPAEPSPTEIGDYDSDGIDDLMVKFDRQEVIDELEWDWTVVYSEEITITLNLNDGTAGEGSDTIKVLPKENKGKGTGKK